MEERQRLTRSAMDSTRTSRDLRIQILFITLTRLVLNTAFRMVYPFLPVLGRGLGVGLPALSQALSLRSFSAMLGPVLAHGTDTRGRKFGMVLGLTLFSAGLLVVALFPGWPAFVIMLVLTALGKSAFDPAIQAYLGDRVPYERRGRAIGITEIGWSLSFIIGVPLVGYLIARGDWSTPFPVLAGLSVLCLGGILWLIPRDVAGALPQSSLWRNLGVVFASPTTILALLVAALLSGASEVINLVFGVWIESSFNVQIAALGMASLVIGFAELGGESLVTAFTDRIGKTRAITGGLALNCLALIALPVLGGNLVTVLVGLFFYYLTFEFSVVSFIPLVTEVLPSARATMMATSAAALFLGRAVTALFASSLYLAGGILFNVSVAVLLNLLALFLLWRFRVSQDTLR